LLAILASPIVRAGLHAGGLIIPSLTLAQGQDLSASLLEEIIITAEKRTERLQDASISVSALPHLPVMKSGS
jgi:hypothetical protein